MIQMGGAHTTSNQAEGILLQSIVMEMGSVSQYFSSEASGPRIDVPELHCAHSGTEPITQVLGYLLFAFPS